MAAEQLLQLDVNINLYGAENTVHEKSMTAIQDIILGYTEGEANYLALKVGFCACIDQRLFCFHLTGLASFKQDADGCRNQLCKGECPPDRF